MSGTSTVTLRSLRWHTFNQWMLLILFMWPAISICQHKTWLPPQLPVVYVLYMAEKRREIIKFHTSQSGNFRIQCERIEFSGFREERGNRPENGGIMECGRKLWSICLPPPVLGYQDFTNKANQAKARKRLHSTITEGNYHWYHSELRIREFMVSRFLNSLTSITLLA